MTPEQAFIEWWATTARRRDHRAGEAWFCKSYREKWRASQEERNDSGQLSEHWWQR